jgi:hypothetical protein
MLVKDSPQVEKEFQFFLRTKSLKLRSFNMPIVFDAMAELWMMCRKTTRMSFVFLALGLRGVQAAEVAPTEARILEQAKKITTTECAQARTDCKYHVIALPANLPAEWKGARWRVMISRPTYVSGYQLYAPGASSERWIDFDIAGKVVDDFVPK